jgi:hypothetical protein
MRRFLGAVSGQTASAGEPDCQPGKRITGSIISIRAYGVKFKELREYPRPLGLRLQSAGEYATACQLGMAPAGRLTGTRHCTSFFLVN